jgi:16S rRNA (guanine527-N7)-methyltransferase
MTYLKQLGVHAELLIQGMQDIGLVTDDKQVERLAQYAGLLHKWGAVYNLTANKEASQIVSLHLLDSLVVVGPLRREVAIPRALLDVGSGAGLPGVVLSIMCPTVQVHCIDAVAKKAAFIKQVAINLGLANLHAHHGRIEDFDGLFDVITSRAFSSLSDFVSLTTKNLAPLGVWMAMKGRLNPDEMEALPAGVDVFHVEPLQVPSVDAVRNIVWLRRKQDDKPN